MPVIISNDYNRMAQKRTVFIRGFWDKNIIPIKQKYDEKHYDLKPSSGLKGFSNLEGALKTAAWKIQLEYAPRNGYGNPNQGLYAWDGEINPNKVIFKNLEEASLVVKDAAKFFGASLVGIAEYDTKWVYSHWYNFSTGESVPSEFPFRVQSVIVAAIRMNYSACLTSPSLISCAATGLGYSNMAETASKLAAFIRTLGYKAIPSGNDTALSIPIAIQAGLGELGRNGLLVTPQYGPCVRILKIFTDMPLKADRPITFGVKQFCLKCKKCAKSCPAGAIPIDDKPTMKGTSISNCSGVLKWYTIPESCFKFWALNGGECNNCITCCPYNSWSSWHHGPTQESTESTKSDPLFFALKSKIDVKNPTKVIIKPSVLNSGPSSIELQQPSEEQGYSAVAYALCKASLFPNQHFYEWDVEPNKIKTRFNVPEEASKIIKKAAKFFGADLVGIANNNEKWISPELHVNNVDNKNSAMLSIQPKSIIVMAVEMDYAAYQAESSLVATAATGMGYSRMAEISVKVATFIRMLGYWAVPCGDGTALSIPMAIEAGLGECGRTGLLITREFGPRVRLCKIFTDLNLKADKPITFGVEEFCSSCMICAEACPAQAIPDNLIIPGAARRATDAKNCFQYWVDNSIDCCKCITKCPFSKPNSLDQGPRRAVADITLDSLRNKPHLVCGKDIKNWWEKR